MEKTVRFGGAQIPVTQNIEKNVNAIKAAIDWAAEHNVDYLITPEAALSGYHKFFDKDLDLLSSSLAEVESYAATCNVGMCLGTLWVEAVTVHENVTIPVKKNQIRYYTKTGQFLGATNKIVMAPVDIASGIVPDGHITGIAVPFDDEIIPTAGLICADLYGWSGQQGGLPQQYNNIGVRLYIHSTNAERGTDPVKNEIEEMWVEAWLRRVSNMQQCPIIVADNCNKMDGSKYSGKTLTQSGVINNGEWVTKVSRYDTQYFYYDLTLDHIILKEPGKHE